MMEMMLDEEMGERVGMAGLAGLDGFPAALQAAGEQVAAEARRLGFRARVEAVSALRNMGQAVARVVMSRGYGDQVFLMADAEMAEGVSEAVRRLAAEMDAEGRVAKEDDDAD